MNSAVSAQIRALDVQCEALRVRRQQLEKRYEARLLTAKDMNFVQLHTLKRNLRKLKVKQETGVPKVERIRQESRKTVDKVNRAVSWQHSSRVALDKEQLAYLSKIDELYGQYEGLVEAENVRMLREMEHEEKFLAQRTAEASAAFEKEVAMKSMLVEQKKKLAVARERQSALASMRAKAREELPDMHRAPEMHVSSERSLSAAVSPTHFQQMQSQTSESKSCAYTFDWQPVAATDFVPVYAETTTTSNGQRLARLPQTFTLEVFIPEYQSAVINVKRNMSVMQVISQVEAAANLKVDHLADSEGMRLEGRVEKVGERFLRGRVRAVVKPSSLPWARLSLGVKRIIELVQQDTRITELRSTKYGLIGRPVNGKTTTHVMQAIGSDYFRGETRQFTAYELIEALKEVLSLQSHALLPLSLFDSGTLPDKTTIQRRIHEYHTNCKDGREQTWQLVVKHWNWLTASQILTAEQVANIFVQPLSLQDDDSCTNRIWHAIQLLSSPCSANEQEEPAGHHQLRCLRDVAMKREEKLAGVGAAGLSSPETDESNDSSIEEPNSNDVAKASERSRQSVLAHLEEFSDVEDDFHLLEEQAEEEDVDFGLE